MLSSMLMKWLAWRATRVRRVNPDVNQVLDDLHVKEGYKGLSNKGYCDNAQRMGLLTKTKSAIAETIMDRAHEQRTSG